jgi:predicted DNA-binding ribbon-helix-helix protein
VPARIVDRSPAQHRHEDTMMKSMIMKRSIVISGHKTSISLEDAFWSGLKEIAKSNKATLASVVAQIESSRQYGNLSSAIRLFVLEHSRNRPAEVEYRREAGVVRPPSETLGAS